MTRTQQASLALASLVAALLVAALFGAHGTAHADAIMGPPDDCAPGAVGRSSHAGQWCAPTTCTADAECAALGERDENSNTTSTREVASACTPSCAAPGGCTHEKRRNARRVLPR